MTKGLRICVAALCASFAAPAAAATFTWGTPSDFDSSSQSFAPVDADTLQFSGIGYAHSHGANESISITAIVDGSSRTLFSTALPTDNSSYLLSSIGPISFARGMVTNIGLTCSACVGFTYHAMASETYSLDVRGGAVPEPATWAFMIVGFGLVGASLRSRRRPGVQATA